MMEYNPFKLEDKKILVTGASSGIGRGIAVACSRMGATVILNGRNQMKLRETLSQLQAGEHMFLAADLTDSDSIVRMVSELPPLDGVIHCAGIGQRVLCKMASEQDVDSVMDANFKGPVMLQTELLKQKKIKHIKSVMTKGNI